MKNNEIKKSFKKLLAKKLQKLDKLANEIWNFKGDELARWGLKQQHKKLLSELDKEIYDFDTNPENWIIESTTKEHALSDVESIHDRTETHIVLHGDYELYEGVGTYYNLITNKWEGGETEENKVVEKLEDSERIQQIDNKKKKLIQEYEKLIQEKESNNPNWNKEKHNEIVENIAQKFNQLISETKQIRKKYEK